MHRSQLASTAFGILWLVIFTVFSFGSNATNGLVIYAFLTAFIGLRKARLIHGDDTAVAASLAYGAALNFGPAAGAIAGALASLAQGIDSQGVPTVRLLGRTAAVAAVGVGAGYIYAAVHIPTFSILHHLAAVLVPAIACVAIVPVIGIRTGLRDKSRMRELALGFGLAAAIRFTYSLCPSEFVLLVGPVVYLTKQFLDELLANDKLGRSGDKPQDLSVLYAEAMNALVAAIDARDRFTRMHTTNVLKLSLAIGRRMKLSSSDMEALKLAALFHDIGKLWVPEHILLRPGKLDPEQYAKMQDHPAMGQRILDKVHFPWPIGAIIRSHHEWWDGSGYPDKVNGEQIPLGARILCLADVFEAMTAKRHYRAANSMQDTLDYVREAAGTHFDPVVVEALMQVIAEEDMLGLDLAVIDNQPAPQDKANAEEISRASGEFVAIFEIAQTASTSLDMEKVLQLLAGKVNSMMACSTSVIFLLDRETRRLDARVALGANAQYFTGAQAMLGRGQTGRVAETGEGIIADYDKSDIILSGSPGKVNDWINPWNAMIIPIVTDEGIIGTINLYHVKGRTFSEDDLRLMTAVAPQVGKAIQNALLFKQTTDSALTDAITGLHNARYLFINLEEELKQAKVLGKVLSILCIDLDNFKTINDMLGHQTGDTALKNTGRLFRAEVRDTDIVCRYAGDEFMIVLPGINRMDALVMKRRIEVAADQEPAYGSGNNQVRVGVSIGVASFPEDGEDVHTLIARADVNMYADKRKRKQKSAA